MLMIQALSVRTGAFLKMEIVYLSCPLDTCSHRSGLTRPLIVIEIIVSLQKKQKIKGGRKEFHWRIRICVLHAIPYNWDCFTMKSTKRMPLFQSAPEEAPVPHGIINNKGEEEIDPVKFYYCTAYKVYWCARTSHNLMILGSVLSTLIFYIRTK